MVQIPVQPIQASYIPPQPHPQAVWSVPPAMGNIPANPYLQTAWNPAVGQVRPATAQMPPTPPVSTGSARLPIRRVSLASPPLGAAGSRNYPNALR
jgi:hypothetical protein